MTHRHEVAVVVTAWDAGPRLADTLRALLDQRSAAPLALRLLLRGVAEPEPSHELLLARGLPEGLLGRLLERGLSVHGAPAADETRPHDEALALVDAPLGVLLDDECTPDGEGFLEALLAPLRLDPDVALVLGAQVPHALCDALGRRQLDNYTGALAGQPLLRIGDGAAGWEAWSRELHGLCACDLACAAVRHAAVEHLPAPAAICPSEPALAEEAWLQRVLESGWSRAVAAEARALRTFAVEPRARLGRMRRAEGSRRKVLLAAPPAALTAPAAAQPERSSLLTAAARLAKGGARAAEVLRDEGAGAVLDRLRGRLRPDAARPWWEQHPYDLVREPRAHVPPPRAGALSGPLRVSFVVPAFYAGSGGHTTIFRLVRWLESFGHDCQVVITSHQGLLPQVPVQVRQLIQQLFQPIRARVHLWNGEPLPDADVHVATHWDTAYVVDRRRRSGAGAYLVQDWEPGFFPVGTGSALVEETYRLGFHHLCAGRWLAERLLEQGARAVRFDLGVDPADYFEQPSTAPPGGRIAVYLRPLTARRGFELVALALAEVKRQRPGVEVAVYGCDPAALQLPFEATLHGVLDHARLRALYAGSTLGLSCSLSNYSLVPQEMMACGLPVVEVDAPSTRAAFHDGHDALLASPNPQGLADAALRLLDDPALRQTLRQNGLARVRPLTWEAAARQVEQGLRRAVSLALGVEPARVSST